MEVFCVHWHCREVAYAIVLWLPVLALACTRHTEGRLWYPIFIVDFCSELFTVEGMDTVVGAGD